MKLIVGGYYVDREGSVHKITSAALPGAYPFADSKSRLYTEAGSCLEAGDYPLDLIREATPDEVIAYSRDEFRARRHLIASEVQMLDTDGLPRWTYAQIGKRNGGISRERVRQIAKQFGVERKAAKAVESNESTTANGGKQ